MPISIIQGARHAFAESAGRNMANPTAILLCASNLLSHLGLRRYADIIQNAVKTTIQAKKVSVTVWSFVVNNIYQSLYETDSDSSNF